jgi:hypothetical protein
MAVPTVVLADGRLIIDCYSGLSYCLQLWGLGVGFAFRFSRNYKQLEVLYWLTNTTAHDGSRTNWALKQHANR